MTKLKQTQELRGIDKMKITRKQLRRIITEARHGRAGLGFEGWQANKQANFAKAYGPDAKVLRDFGSNSDRVHETCGGDPEMDMHTDGPPIALEPALAAGPIAENLGPEQEVMVEMEVAQRSLEQVIESVQIAASLCPSCGDTVAAQAPLVEAMVKQAEALLETLDAQIGLVAESAGGGEVLDMVDVVTELV